MAHTARIVFLGTAAALPTADRTNTSLVIAPDAPGVESEQGATPGLLIDCGGDVYGRMRRCGVAPDAVSDLLITHAHIDHIGSLPSLLESFRLGGRTRPLRILALPVVLEVARALIAAFNFELTLDDWTYAVTFEPVEHGQTLTLAGVPARIVGMRHSIPSVGVRLDFPSGAVAYTCDTEPNPNVSELARDARTLITECTFLQSGVAFARQSKHTTALEAGREAAEMGVETLALVHLGVAEGMSLEAARDEVRQNFAGRILMPNDGDTLDV